MPDPLPVSLPLRTTGLATRKPTRFDLVADAVQRRALAELLGISAIPALRFKGEVRPAGRTDFVLEGVLQVTVVQPCVVSLAPVTTEIEEPVIRRYLADFTQPGEDEAEIPADDSEEPLPAIIDPGAVMTEALALALPDYPRAPGAALDESVHAAPGVVPLRDGDLRPFASLSKRLSGIDPDEGGS